MFFSCTAADFAAKRPKETAVFTQMKGQEDLCGASCRAGHPSPRLHTASVAQACKSFKEWFLKKGGTFENFHESINRIAGQGTNFCDTLHQIRMLRRKLADEQNKDKKSAWKLIKLIHEALGHRNDGRQSNQANGVPAGWRVSSTSNSPVIPSTYPSQVYRTYLLRTGRPLVKENLPEIQYHYGVEMPGGNQSPGAGSFLGRASARQPRGHLLAAPFTDAGVLSAD